MKLLRSVLTAGLVGAAALLAAEARANVTVIGGGLAEDCSKAAKLAAAQMMTQTEAMHECNLALEEEVLNPHDLAGTYVNRGVLYLVAFEWDAALKDFDHAIRIQPQMGEAWVNRGAALVGLHRDAEGIQDIDKGLGLEPSEPEKAYFNRAVAKENLADLKGAYEDYRKALELKPDWDMPKSELKRFQVVQR